MITIYDFIGIFFIGFGLGNLFMLMILREKFRKKVFKKIDNYLSDK